MNFGDFFKRARVRMERQRSRRREQRQRRAGWIPRNRLVAKMPALADGSVAPAVMRPAVQPMRRLPVAARDATVKARWTNEGRGLAVARSLYSGQDGFAVSRETIKGMVDMAKARKGRTASGRIKRGFKLTKGGLVSKARGVARGRRR